MNDKIADKIRKLFALADAAGTPEEAANAMHHAQALMTRHAIDEATIRASMAQGGDAGPQPIVSRVVRTWGRQVPQWQVYLIGTITACNHCSALIRRRRKSGESYAEVWGTADSIERVAQLLDRVAGQIEALCKRAKANGQIDTGKTAGNNFRLGATQIVCQRLLEGQQKALADVQADPKALRGADGACTALAILAADADRADSAMRGDCPKIRTYQASTSKGDAGAWAAGQRAGGQVNLTSSKALR